MGAGAPESILFDRMSVGGSIKRFLSAECRPSTTLAFTFLPWLAAVFEISGINAALNLIGYAALVSLVGYAIIGFALPASARRQALVLVPAAGVLSVSSIGGIWLRLGLPLAWVPALWLALAVAALPILWSDRPLFTQKSVSYGASIAALSLLVCAIFFYPAARRDAVLRRDGSYNWIYVDTQYFHSLAADIASGDRPPRAPGDSAVELRYHFAAYSPSEAISHLTGLDLGDAFARVTRGSSFWALLLSVFGLGTLLSRKANGGSFGGIMAVAGLFFYGSLLSLFTDAYNSSGYVTGAILFKIPEVDVVADGGPFAHLILGHSMLHGLNAVSAVLGLCLLQEEAAPVAVWRRVVLVLLPALTIPVNSVASLYCLGAVCVLLFWARLDRASSWLLIGLTFLLYYGAWKIMDYSHAPDTAVAAMNHHPYLLWWSVAIEFTIGFGFRLVGFCWISQPLRRPFAFLVLAGSCGLLLFFLSLQLEGNERYGLYYLQALFSVFAFSRLTPDFWQRAKRIQWVSEWLGTATIALAILAASGILIALFAHFKHHPTNITYFHTKIAVTVLAFALLFGTSALARRSQMFAAASSAVLMGVLFVGFLAWITPWLNYAMGRARKDITLTAGEVQGLVRLKEASAQGELFATNKHAVDSLVTNRERSYAYGTLASRPVLLEGYLYHGVVDLPDFKRLLSDNDQMFTTTDGATLHHLAAAYHVQWLVARPGTDISVPKPLPAWLHELQATGDLKIYKVE